ncbi:MAG: hypothetical protein LUQ25_02200 [Methanoregulaceae archaeon]|nr:hypothetical protein [Methanoregulaceae archaeon]
MRKTIIGSRAILAIAVLLGGGIIFCGAASGAEVENFNPFNQAFTENLIEETTFGGWYNQVDPADYHSTNWFTQPQRNSLFNQTDYNSFATVDPKVSQLMDNALKNYLKKKTVFTPLSGGPAYIWCNGGA